MSRKYSEIVEYDELQSGDVVLIDAFMTPDERDDMKQFVGKRVIVDQMFERFSGEVEKRLTLNLPDSTSIGYCIGFDEYNNCATQKHLRLRFISGRPKFNLGDDVRVKDMTVMVVAFKTTTLGNSYTVLDKFGKTYEVDEDSVIEIGVPVTIRTHLKLVQGNHREFAHNEPSWTDDRANVEITFDSGDPSKILAITILK